ncbi:MAG: hypothetical protein EOM20_08560 [Spartobacteria bacterium]|nr:hypothetical protein [Spartobacteria bacterium]
MMKLTKKSGKMSIFACFFQKIGHFSSFLRIFLVVLAVGAGVCRAQAESTENDPREVWLPFKRGYWANCSRGAAKGHGWIFNLVEGPPVVAAEDGRVILIDHPNRIIVDHGGGLLGFYEINGRWEAEVIPGELISAGTELADIDTRGNRKGRGDPMLNFSVRGPTLQKTHDVRFRLAGSKKAVDINKKTKYLSGTRKSHASQGNFRDSTLRGNEFREQGVLITSANHMYWLPGGKETMYEGKALKEADAVVFQLWTSDEAGKKKLAYEEKAAPDDGNHFVLSVTIPAHISGNCWYRLGARNKGGIKGGTQIPARVDSRH